MKGKIIDTLKQLLSLLAIFLVSVTVIVIYGTWPRDNYEPLPEGFVESLEIDSGEIELLPVTNTATLAYVSQDCDGFADNFDYPPDEGGNEIVNYQTMTNHLLEPISLDEVIDALIEVENPRRDPEAIGDKHMTNKAYGLLQIRKPYLDDVNRIAGTSYTTEDMKDEALARWAAKIYLNYYGSAYEGKTGRYVTPEVYGRIHNGGPNGWKKSSTNDYGEKVSQILSDR